MFYCHASTARLPHGSTFSCHLVPNSDKSDCFMCQYHSLQSNSLPFVFIRGPESLILITVIVTVLILRRIFFALPCFPCKGLLETDLVCRVCITVTVAIAFLDDGESHLYYRYCCGHRKNLICNDCGWDGNLELQKVFHKQACTWRITPSCIVAVRAVCVEGKVRHSMLSPRIFPDGQQLSSQSPQTKEPR